MEVDLLNCNKADIYSASGPLLCNARVHWDSAGFYLLLEVPADFPLDEEAEYPILFYDPAAGLVHSHCKLKAHSKTEDGDLALSCTVLDVIQTIQRRQDLKVPATAQIEVSVVTMPRAAHDKQVPLVSEIAVSVTNSLGEDEQDLLPPKNASFTALTQNLSAGGVYFICPYALPVDTEVRFELHEGPKPIELTAVVLRTEALPPYKKQPRFGHGCRFITLKPVAESGLRSYIFRCQRNMRQRRF